MRCKSGEERNFEVHLSAMSSVQLIMFVDLSERRFGRAADRRVRELSQQVIEKTTSGIVVTSKMARLFWPTSRQQNIS